MNTDNVLPEVVPETDKKKPFSETAFGGFVGDFFGNLYNGQSSVGTPPITISNLNSNQWNPDPLEPLPPLPPAKPPKNNEKIFYVLGGITVLSLVGYMAYSHSKKNKKSTSKKNSLDGVGEPKTPKIKTIML